MTLTLYTLGKCPTTELRPQPTEAEIEVRPSDQPEALFQVGKRKNGQI